MGTARQTIRIDVPTERVWEVLVDAERLPEWNAEVVAVEDVTGPLDRPGASYTQVFTAGGREVRGRFEIVAVEQFRSREMRASLPMMSRAVGRDTLVPAGEGTELTVELEFELKGGRVARMGEPLLTRRMEQALARSGEALKRLLESGA
jgi:uncharacterized protein YndB with AHSA1/START domain